MMSFRGRLKDFRIPQSTSWLLTDIAEAKGRQALYKKQAPQILKALLEMALIQSTESSNRIEGVTVEADRLRPLVLGSVRPKDRSEREILGYRRALSLIHTRAAELHVTAEVLRELHRTIQPDSGDAGEWKKVSNEITEVRPGQAPVIRFRPVSVEQTPAAMDELCVSYRHAIDQEGVQPPVALAALVLDFLCIHPFRDGNGRVSRLLALVGLYHHGIEVGRYISLERLVEETKEDYYEVLKESSVGWHEGKHDLIPWMNYFLGGVRRAYRMFGERAGKVTSARGAKTGLLLDAIQAYVGDFTAADLQGAVPGVSLDLVRRVLDRERRKGNLICVGRGRAAKWRRNIGTKGGN